MQLAEDTRALQDLVRKLVARHQTPLETRVLRGGSVEDDDYAPGQEAAREAGLWGLDVPEEYGGAALSMTQRVAVTEENYRCLTPLRFGGRALPILFDLGEHQKAKFLYPILAGDMRFAFAQTEPHGGSDPGGAMRTVARKTARGWVINGTKVFISVVANADYIFVFAVTDPEKRQRGGISMFAVHRDNPGIKLMRPIEMLGGFITHELIFEDCGVGDDDLLSIEGNGFSAAQKALSDARFDVAARALGIAQRAYEMMVTYAKQRSVFGEPLSERQAIQSMIVDSWIEIHQARLTLYDGAAKQDDRQDTRVEAGLVKMLATELVCRVVDRAIQVHGAAGCALDNPLAHWYNSQRLARIYEGPTELHKYRVLARHLLS
ncbi:MAG TPA: acyl-CoA dehydrogenase family protein [Reyranella sp.]|nr:acyl-CoA dehydrogenase family protein [Reyranella sp.]